MYFILGEGVQSEDVDESEGEEVKGEKLGFCRDFQQLFCLYY